ncbi:MAG: hydroxymethylbilane synthase [Alphaproteobacteria bacterium]|nr:hydroxymethylbilane synthase [Alphaproteobacteria bacterium]
MSPGSVPLRIGTRGSALALWQAEEVRRRLLAAHPTLTAAGVVLAVIRTTGDRITSRPLAEIGGKGLFTKELEEALLAGAIDLAVHSMKDMPTILPQGLAVPCLLPREDPRDAFLSAAATAISALPQGARVGTASLRRAAQIRRRRPDLVVVPFRGNVDTRLRKLAAGEVAATLLALAGLRRLGLADRVTAVLDPVEMLPAVAQGAIGIECRSADAATHALLAPLHHEATARCVSAERALLAVLDGSCHTPIAALATEAAGELALRALILTPDGREAHETTRRGAAREAVALGRDAGEELRRRAGPHFFADG